MAGFLQNIRERRMAQWLLAYSAAAWTISQILDVLQDPWGMPDGLIRASHIVLIAGFLIALVLAWYHGEKGRQRVSGPELLIITLLMTLVGGVLMALRPRQAVNLPSLAEADMPAVAVLAFDNFSPDANDAYFADGIHEEIISKLARVGGLRVRGRISVLRYREQPKPMPEIARELDVDFILEGSVRKTAGAVRITAQLIDARQDTHLWAADYDRELTMANLLDVQREIADRVVRELHAVMSPVEAAAVAHVATNNLEAYDAWLQAQYHARSSGADAKSRATQHFNRAVALDPEFGVAWAGLAISWLQTVEGDDFYAGADSARNALRRAVELAPEDPTTSLARGVWAYYMDYDLGTALEYFERARALVPSDPEPVKWIAWVHRRAGRWDAALEAHERALRLDPLATAGLSAYFLTAQSLRDWDLAIRLNDRLIDIEPAAIAFHLQRLFVLISRDGTLDRARAWVDSIAPGRPPAMSALLQTSLAIYARDFDRARQLVPEQAWTGAAEEAALFFYLSGDGAQQRAWGDTLVRRADRLLATLPDGLQSRILPSLIGTKLASKALGFALRGDRSAAHEALAQLAAVLPVEVDAYVGGSVQRWATWVHIVLGEHDEAITSIETQLGMPALISTGLLRADPMYDPLRDLPRFRALIAPPASSN